MTLVPTNKLGERWLELADDARARARRANARAAESPYPEMAAAFEREAELNFAAAQTWSGFAELSRHQPRAAR